MAEEQDALIGREDEKYGEILEQVEKIEKEQFFRVIGVKRDKQKIILFLEDGSEKKVNFARKLGYIKDLLKGTDVELKQRFKRVGLVLEDEVVYELRQRLRELLVYFSEEPNYGIIKLKVKKHPCFNLKLHHEVKLWNEGKEWYDIVYKIYKFKPTRGKAYNMFIFTDAETTLPTGNAFLPLKPLTPGDINRFGKRPEKHVVDDVAKPLYAKYVSIYGKEDGKEKVAKMSWSDMLTELSQMKYVFKVGEPFSNDEMVEIESWDFNKVLDDYISEGLVKDEILKQIYKAQLIKFARDPYKSENVCEKTQPYNSHAIISTPTKTGKTATSEKIGRRCDEASVARLVGFATAQDVYEGEADGQSSTFIIDNFHELRNPKSLIGMLELLETGEYEVLKGKKV